MQNKEVEILSNTILRNISKYEQLHGHHESDMENAVAYGLDETVFTICKVLIDLGYTNQEKNNELALDILGRSLIEAIPMVKQEDGQFQKLFYSWINSQEDQEAS